MLKAYVALQTGKIKTDSKDSKPLLTPLYFERFYGFHVPLRTNNITRLEIIECFFDFRLLFRHERLPFRSSQFVTVRPFFFVQPFHDKL